MMDMQEYSHRHQPHRKVKKPIVLAALAIVVALLISSGLVLWFLVFSPQLDEKEVGVTNAAQREPPQQSGNNDTTTILQQPGHDSASQPPPSLPPIPAAKATTTSPSTQHPTNSLSNLPRVSNFPTTTTGAPTTSTNNDTITTTQTPSQNETLTNTTGGVGTTPTTAPTIVSRSELFVPPNPVPEDPARSYFNYDILDTRYGPNVWPAIDMSGTYWSEFGANGYGPWNNHFSSNIPDPTKNRCGQLGRQSPIDLTPAIDNNCTAVHQIRPREGRLPLSSGMIEKRFEPNALRVLLNRRPCLDINVDECRLYRPPLADFPHYSSTVTQYADLMHLDLKVPGEHTIRGQRFDAEMQLMHIHLEDPRVAYIGIPIQVQEDAYNEKFQALLDQFQAVYTLHQAQCAVVTTRHLRQRRSVMFYQQKYNQNPDQSTILDDPNLQRRLQSGAFFDPYSDFLEGFYFFRYNGSSPDPPCFPSTWFVMTTPVVIGSKQLRQMKYLLFTHIDGDCQPTSVHNIEQSVTRPIQPLGNLPDTDDVRDFMLCQEDDFSPDNNSGK